MVEDFLSRFPKLWAVLIHPLVSPFGHGLVCSAATVAGWALFLLVVSPDPGFGAGLGYGAAMYFYTTREWGDLGRFVFNRQWSEAGVQLKAADSWLDWTVPLIMGLMTAHLLPG